MIPDGSGETIKLTKLDNSYTIAAMLSSSATTFLGGSEDQCIVSCLDRSNCGAAFVAFSDSQGESFHWCALLQITQTSIMVVELNSTSWSQTWGSSMPEPATASITIFGKSTHRTSRRYDPCW